MHKEGFNLSKDANDKSSFNLICKRLDNTAVSCVKSKKRRAKSCTKKGDFEKRSPVNHLSEFCGQQLPAYTEPSSLMFCIFTCKKCNSHSSIQLTTM